MLTRQRVVCICLAVAALGAGISGCGTQEKQSLYGICLKDTDCRDPFKCIDSECAIVKSTVCAPNKLRCNGASVEKCNEAGDKWVADPVCPTGACETNTTEGQPGAACVPGKCTKLERKCAADLGEYADQKWDAVRDVLVLTCLSNGTGYVATDTCPTKCGTAADGKPGCVAPTCVPGQTRCKEGAEAVQQVCNARGTLWEDVPCPTTAGAAQCVAGQCRQKVCEAGAERCRGNQPEKCATDLTGFVASGAPCAGACKEEGTPVKAVCAPIVCVPGATRCKDGDNTKVETCNVQGTGRSEAACGTAQAPGVCVQGQCVPKQCSVVRDGAGAITSRQQRCAANWRQQCADTEDGWVNFGDAGATPAACAYGCRMDGAGNATCASPACSTSQRVCSADNKAVLACLPDQTGFAFQQYCATNCVAHPTGADSPAACAPTLCSPATRRCTGDSPPRVQLCNADGSAWVELESCVTSCTNGRCFTGAEVCTPGEVRCRAGDSEKCVALPGGGTEWRFQDRCLGACENGQCALAAGACGCANLPADKVCSGDPAAANAVAPVKVNYQFAIDGGTDVPMVCDDVSRLLLYTDPITDSSGRLVPDGTLVTFTLGDGVSETLASPDADPNTPNLQRPTLRGRARVLVKAPAGGAGCEPHQVTLVASLGGACSGRATFKVNPVPEDQYWHPVYVADDFATTSLADPTRTDVDWDTGYGMISAPSVVAAGDCADGDLVVPAIYQGAGCGTGTNPPCTDRVDLWAAGYARAFNVTGWAENYVQVDSFLPNLQAGDEILLYVMGPAGTGATAPVPSSVQTGADFTGIYEFKRVKSVGSYRIEFTAPIAENFPSAATSWIVAQRVPNFRDVTVHTPVSWWPTVSTRPAGAVNGMLTTRSLVDTNGASATYGQITGTGILAMRVCGTFNAWGSVTMDGAGLTSATGTQYAVAQPTLNRLLHGAAGKNTSTSWGHVGGGGIVFVAARSLVMAQTPDASPVWGSLTANGAAGYNGGSGGTVWLMAGELKTGANAIMARAGTGGGAAGRIRLDYAWVNTSPVTTTPTVGFVWEGKRIMYSQIAYNEPTAPTTYKILNGSLVYLLGGVGETNVGQPTALGSGYVVEFSPVASQIFGKPDATGFINFMATAFGDPNSVPRRTFRVRFTMTPLEADRQELLGFQAYLHSGG